MDTSLKWFAKRVITIDIGITIHIGLLGKRLEIAKTKGGRGKRFWRALQNKT